MINDRRGRLKYDCTMQWPGSYDMNLFCRSICKHLLVCLRARDCTSPQHITRDVSSRITTSTSFADQVPIQPPKAASIKTIIVLPRKQPTTRSIPTFNLPARDITFNFQRSYDSQSIHRANLPFRTPSSKPATQFPQINEQASKQASTSDFSTFSSP